MEAENIKFYREQCGITEPDTIVKIENPKAFRLKQQMFPRL